MSTARKPTWVRLPCIRCATEIPELIEGVTLRCLQCGADNTFTEASKFLEKLAKTNLGKVPSIDFICVWQLGECGWMKKKRNGYLILKFNRCKEENHGNQDKENIQDRQKKAGTSSGFH